MMTTSWKTTITELLDGVEAELCPSTPIRARAVLASYREAVDAAKSRTARRSLERTIDICIQSKPYYRAAARRYLTSQVTQKVVPVLKELLDLAKEHNRRRAADREQGH